MRNYWLNKSEYTVPQIKQAYNHGDWHNKWYVTKQLKSEVEEYERNKLDDSLGIPNLYNAEPDHYYLHKDGIWFLNSTLKDEKWTGYYDTKEEAESALLGQLL